MKSPIEIEAEIVDKHLQRGKLPCMVHLIITNVSGESILVNRRLGVGYRDSFDREIFLEIFDEGRDVVVSEPAEDYQRDPAMPQDYQYLEPEGQIVGSFDLCEWYYFPLPLAGDFEMVVYYQADGPHLDNPPEDLLHGIHASSRIPFKIIS